MTVRAVIIDDEQNNIDNLEILLNQHCPQVQVAGRALSADEGKAIIEQTHPDIVFLDIQMPRKSGLDMLRELRNRNFELVFVTAYDQYGIQAVKFSAIDYLLKPIDTTELATAVQKAIYRSTEKKQNERLENLLQLVSEKQGKTEHRIALASAKETRFIRTADIIRCESSNNYTTFYIDGGEKILVSKPMFEYEELLAGYGFIRCHQTHLVNKRYVRSLLKEDGGYLLLEDETQVPVSRTRKAFVKSELEKR